MFYYIEGRYKKLIFYSFETAKNWSFETAKNWSFETAKNWIYETFLQATFLQFQNCKKLLMGTAISYFIILLPLSLPLFEKAHFFSFKTEKKTG